MSQTINGTKAGQFPISQSVGQQYAPQAGNGGTRTVPPSIAVPPPNAALTINGVRVTIDVRSLTGAQIVAILNTIPGITASINGTGAITVSGVNSITGEASLRAILGFF
jgi:hypothetical protein